MRCALVFYFVATIFAVVYSLPEQCEIIEEDSALCGRKHVRYTFDFVPPVSRNITYIDLDGQPLKQLPYNAFRNLTSQNSMSAIWLRHCQISHVDAGALLNLHNLITISLSHNQINQIDSKLFSHTEQIRFVFMAYNRIEVLPNGLFQNLTQLEAVYLNDNRIRQVENYSFKNTPSLESITLGNNQIEFMNNLFKDKIGTLLLLELNDNPWKCNCELGPLYEYLSKYDHLNQPGLECETPPRLHGRNWSDISRDEFVCSSEDATSTLDTVMTSTEPTTTTEQDDNIPVTVYSGKTLPAIAKRRSVRRTNSGNMDSGLPTRVVQSSTGSDDNDSGSNMADVDEETVSIHHYRLREATTN